MYFYCHAVCAGLTRNYFCSCRLQSNVVSTTGEQSVNGGPNEFTTFAAVASNNHSLGVSPPLLSFPLSVDIAIDNEAPMMELTMPVPENNMSTGAAAPRVFNTVPDANHQCELLPPTAFMQRRDGTPLAVKTSEALDSGTISQQLVRGLSDVSPSVNAHNLNSATSASAEELIQIRKTLREFADNKERLR